MNDQIVEQRTSTAPSGWHYLPEVFLAGLAGGALWLTFLFPTEREPWWLYPALCTALPATVVAVLLVGPRRLLDALAAFGIVMVTMAALNVSACGQAFALLVPGAFLSVGLAIGLVAAHVAGRLGSDTNPRTRRRRSILVGTLLGVLIMGLLLLYLVASPAGDQTATAIGVILLYVAWIVVSPLWLATILMIAFLAHQKRSRASA